MIGNPVDEIFVVVPVYNAEAFLPQCIESVIAQTFPGWRMVVVDDGSRDDSFLVASRYAARDCRVQVHKQQNKGVAAARNTGLEFVDAGARYVIFLDNDDYLEPDALLVLKQRLESSPQAVAAYGLARDVGKDGANLSSDAAKEQAYKRLTAAQSPFLTVPVDEPTTFASFVVWPWIETPGQVLIRFSALDKAGDFDSETVPSDDWDMWLRLSTYGNFEFVQRIVMNKRSHGDNVSKNGKVMAVAEPVIRRKLVTSNLFTPEQKRLAHRGQLLSCLVKLSWAKSDLRQGRPLAAAKQVYRAGRSYARYLQVTWTR